MTIAAVAELMFLSSCDLEPQSKLNSVKVNRHAKYLGQRSFDSKVIARTHAHSGSITLPGPLKWSVIPQLINAEA